MHLLKQITIKCMNRITLEVKTPCLANEPSASSVFIKIKNYILFDFTCTVSKCQCIAKIAKTNMSDFKISKRACNTAIFVRIKR